MALKDLMIDEISFQYGFEEGRKYAQLEREFEGCYPYCKEFEELFFSSPVDYGNRSYKARQILFFVIEEGMDNFSRIARKLKCSREYVRQVIEAESSGISYYKRRLLTKGHTT